MTQLTRLVPDKSYVDIIGVPEELENAMDAFGLALQCSRLTTPAQILGLLIDLVDIDIASATSDEAVTFEAVRDYLNAFKLIHHDQSEPVVGIMLGSNMLEEIPFGREPIGFCIKVFGDLYGMNPADTLAAMKLDNEPELFSKYDVSL